MGWSRERREGVEAIAIAIATDDDASNVTEGDTYNRHKVWSNV